MKSIFFWKNTFFWRKKKFWKNICVWIFEKTCFERKKIFWKQMLFKKNNFFLKKIFLKKFKKNFCLCRLKVLAPKSLCPLQTVWFQNAFMSRYFCNVFMICVTKLAQPSCTDCFSFEALFIAQWLQYAMFWICRISNDRRFESFWKSSRTRMYDYFTVKTVLGQSVDSTRWLKTMNNRHCGITIHWYVVEQQLLFLQKFKF